MYRIYGRKKTEQRMKPYDSYHGALVTKLIYATLYRDDQLEDLRKEVEQMRSMNPKYVFAIRSVKDESKGR